MSNDRQIVFTIPTDKKPKTYIIDFNIAEVTTIAELKEKIFQETQISPAEQRVFYRGGELSDAVLTSSLDDVRLSMFLRRPQAAATEATHKNPNACDYWLRRSQWLALFGTVTAGTLSTLGHCGVMSLPQFGSLSVTDVVSIALFLCYTLITIGRAYAACTEENIENRSPFGVFA